MIKNIHMKSVILRTLTLTSESSGRGTKDLNDVSLAMSLVFARLAWAFGDAEQSWF